MKHVKIITASVVSAAAMIGAGVQEYAPEQASEVVAYQIACVQAHALHDRYVFESTRGKMAFTDGEAHRPEITAKAYARMGIGIAASLLSLIHISEPTRPRFGSRMPSSA